MIRPLGTTPLLEAVYVCDVYNLDGFGGEELTMRKRYNLVGQAKAYRTRAKKLFQDCLKHWQWNIDRGLPDHRWRMSNNCPVFDQRYVVYALTPNGYETIP